MAVRRVVGHLRHLIGRHTTTLRDAVATALG